MAIGLPGVVFLLISLLGVPWLAMKSRLDVEQLRSLPRTQSYRMAITQQLVMLVVALLIAWMESLRVIGGRSDTIAGAVAGMALLVIVLALRPLWRRKAQSGEPGLLFLAPRTPADRVAGGWGWRWWWAFRRRYSGGA
jgi:hypothetical protein